MLRRLPPLNALKAFETAGRHATWGTQTMPTSHLRSTLKIMEYWESVTTPE